MKYLNKVIEIKDFRGEGDIVIDQKEPNLFVLYIELYDVGGSFVEESGSYSNLADAMSDVTDILKVNIENDFYDGGVK